MTTPRKDTLQTKPAKSKVHSSPLASSPGDLPQELISKDISPNDAAWADLHERDIKANALKKHTEALLDEAVDESFPASDPVAEMPSTHGSQQYGAGNDEEEEMLDHAIEMTFPASDPIAMQSSEELHHEKDLRKSRPDRTGSPAR